MNKKLLVLFILSFSLLLFSRAAFAQKTVEEKEATSSPVVAKKLDYKASILAEYLASYNSPLQYHAQDFIDASETFNLDWKMVPAIAGVESTFGKQIPGGYNAWGWGVYGSQAIYFQSWRDGIFTVAKGLRENYLNKGLDNPYSINRIYASSPVWGSKVTYFMQDLEKFASQFEANRIGNAQIGMSPNIAAGSGQLVLR